MRDFPLLHKISTLAMLHPSPLWNDFAKEDKAIYHEYGHAVIYDLESGIESDGENEEGAISEGIPDYWAGAFTDHPISAEYVSDDPDFIRDMANPEISSYAEYQNDDTTSSWCHSS